MKEFKKKKVLIILASPFYLDKGSCVRARSDIIAWANPLQHIDQPPLGYIVEHWDPRKQIEDSAKYIISGNTITAVRPKVEEVRPQSFVD